MEGRENNLPPGFRFHPTDEELISYYLINKVSCFDFTSRAMADVDLNKCEPWDLPAKASMGEKEWYFFSMKDRKYPTGMRTNRATEAGYWKTTGKDKEIYVNGVLMGMKKTLVFYKGRAPKGEKTNWVMHEYRLEPKHAFKSSQEEWVVCRIFQKSSTVKRHHQTPSSPQSQESPANDQFGDINEILAINSSTTQDNDHHQGLNLDGLDWNAIREAANITWPANNYTNLAIMNPFLLRAALQLRTTFNPPPEIADYSMISSGISNHNLTDVGIGSGVDSSIRVLDHSVQQQQELEEPFNLDTSNIW